MMAGAENRLVEHLRHRRGQLGRVEHRLDDVTARLGRVERPAADHSVQLAETNIKLKLDRSDACVTPVEKRLDLVEGH